MSGFGQSDGLLFRVLNPCTMVTWRFLLIAPISHRTSLPFMKSRECVDRRRMLRPPKLGIFMPSTLAHSVRMVAKTLLFTIEGGQFSRLPSVELPSDRPHHAPPRLGGVPQLLDDLVPRLPLSPEALRFLPVELVHLGPAELPPRGAHPLQPRLRALGDRTCSCFAAHARNDSTSSLIAGSNFRSSTPVGTSRCRKAFPLSLATWRWGRALVEELR